MLYYFYPSSYCFNLLLLLRKVPKVVLRVANHVAAVLAVPMAVIANGEIVIALEQDTKEVIVKIVRKIYFKCLVK